MPSDLDTGVATQVTVRPTVHTPPAGSPVAGGGGDTAVAAAPAVRTQIFDNAAVTIVLNVGNQLDAAGAITSS